MNRSRLIVIAALVSILAAAGCGTMHLSLGEVPATNPSSFIEPGKTTRQDIQAKYGPPDLEGRDKEGLPTWTYTRMALKVRQMKETEMTGFFNLTVSFEGEVVDSYSYDLKAE